MEGVSAESSFSRSSWDARSLLILIGCQQKSSKQQAGNEQEAAAAAFEEAKGAGGFEGFGVVADFAKFAAFEVFQGGGWVAQGGEAEFAADVAFGLGDAEQAAEAGAAVAGEDFEWHVYPPGTIVSAC